MWCFTCSNNFSDKCFHYFMYLMFDCSKKIKKKKKRSRQADWKDIPYTWYLALISRPCHLHRWHCQFALSLSIRRKLEETSNITQTLYPSVTDVSRFHASVVLPFQLDGDNSVQSIQSVNRFQLSLRLTIHDGISPFKLYLLIPRYTI